MQLILLLSNKKQIFDLQTITSLIGWGPSMPSQKSHLRDIDPRSKLDKVCCHFKQSTNGHLHVTTAAFSLYSRC